MLFGNPALKKETKVEDCEIEFSLKFRPNALSKPNQGGQKLQPKAQWSPIIVTTLHCGFSLSDIYNLSGLIALP